MAFQEFTYQNGYDALKKIISALASEWEFVQFGPIARTASGWLAYKDVSDSLGDVQAGVWYDLSHPLAFEETVTDGSGNTLNDYDIDRLRGKIKFDNSHSGVTVAYKFKPVSIVWQTTALSTFTFRFATVVAVFDTEDQFYFGFGRWDEVNNTIVSLKNSAVAWWGNGGKGWVFVNSNRGIIVVESEGKYSQVYGGVYIPLMETSLVPWVATGSHYIANSRSSTPTHSSTSNDIRNLRNSQGEMILATGEIIAISKKLPSYPFDCSNDDTIRYPASAERFLFPIITDSYNPSGVLDGVYWCPDAELTAETTITTSDGAEYIVFPDVFRTDWCHFIAIKKE